MRIKITVGRSCIEYDEATKECENPEITFSGRYDGKTDRAEKLMSQIQELFLMTKEAEKQRIENDL